MAHSTAFKASGIKWLAMVGVVVTVIAPGIGRGAAHLYRYLNEQGRVEISHTVPAERVSMGYEVIDPSSGRVVEVVEPQKSPEELARLHREKQARMACEDALERVNALYQSEADIAQAEEQAIRALDGRIVNTEANLAHVRNQKRDFETTAAQLERAGRSLDPKLVRNIERARAQARNLEVEIEQRHREQDDARMQFAKDLALFRQASCSDQVVDRFLAEQSASPQDQPSSVN